MLPIIWADIVRQRRFFLTNLVAIAAFGVAGMLVGRDWWWGWFALWLLPRATWFQMVTRFRNIAEHALVAKNEPDPLRHARTTKANWLERALIAPYYVNYHCEHHMFMHVPCYHLPKVHKLLGEKGVLARMVIASGLSPSASRSRPRRERRSNRRSASGFILANTRLQHPPHTPELDLYLADEVTPIWRLTEEELGEMGLPPPFWAFAWAGGQALARYLLDHPFEVAAQARVRPGHRLRHRGHRGDEGRREGPLNGCDIDPFLRRRRGAERRAPTTSSVGLRAPRPARERPA